MLGKYILFDCIVCFIFLNCSLLRISWCIMLIASFSLFKNLFVYGLLNILLLLLYYLDNSLYLYSKYLRISVMVNECPSSSTTLYNAANISWALYILFLRSQNSFLHTFELFFYDVLSLSSWELSLSTRISFWLSVMSIRLELETK